MGNLILRWFMKYVIFYEEIIIKITRINFVGCQIWDYCHAIFRYLYRWINLIISFNFCIYTDNWMTKLFSYFKLLIVVISAKVSQAENIMGCNRISKYWRVHTYSHHKTLMTANMCFIQLILTSWEWNSVMVFFSTDFTNGIIHYPTLAHFYIAWNIKISSY